MILNPPKFVLARNLTTRGLVIDQVRLGNQRKHQLLVVWPDGRETTVPQRRMSVLTRGVWVIN